MIRPIVTLLFCFSALSTAAMADEIEDIKASALGHFATQNAGDIEGWALYHTAEHTGFAAGGGELIESNSREQLMGRLKPRMDDGLKTDYEFRDLKVKVYGDAAVVTGYVVGTLTQPDGSVQQVNNRRTAVLVKEGGRWREAHAHNSARTPSLSQ
jgi:ketosteroid isomerase-like protein